jgi:hypothetical protein
VGNISPANPAGSVAGKWTGIDVGEEDGEATCVGLSAGSVDGVV